jgi:pimeloyl-ACP methyl ester carboxylesterase
LPLVSTPPTLALAAGVRPISVPTRRGDLAALECAPGGTSTLRPVVLVPGFTGSKEDFIAVLAPIAAAGHPVLAYDQRGQYESRGDDDPASYEVGALAEDLLAVTAHVGGPVHVVGHSFGGIVSRAAVLADSSAFRSLVLLDSGPAGVPDPGRSTAQRLVQALAVLDLSTIWAMGRQMDAQAARDRGEAVPPPDVEEFLRRRFVANNPVGLARLGEQLMGAADQVEELAAVGLPGLVVFGEGDDAWPPGLQVEMAQRLGVDAVPIAGAGHSPAATHPEATVEVLLRFWAGLG